MRYTLELDKGTGQFLSCDNCMLREGDVCKYLKHTVSKVEEDARLGDCPFVETVLAVLIEYEGSWVLYYACQGGTVKTVHKGRAVFGERDELEVKYSPYKLHFETVVDYVQWFKDMEYNMDELTYKDLQEIVQSGKGQFIYRDF